MQVSVQLFKPEGSMDHAHSHCMVELEMKILQASFSMLGAEVSGLNELISDHLRSRLSDVPSCSKPRSLTESNRHITPPILVLPQTPKTPNPSIGR